MTSRPSRFERVRPFDELLKATLDADHFTKIRGEQRVSDLVRLGHDRIAKSSDPFPREPDAGNANLNWPDCNFF